MEKFGEWFGKYVGVQGLMGLGLVGGYIFMATSGATIPEDYKSLMTLVLGFYFAKNGVSVLEKLKGLFGVSDTQPISRKR